MIQAEAPLRLRLKYNLPKDLTAFFSNAAVEALLRLRQNNPNEPLSSPSPPSPRLCCVPPPPPFSPSPITKSSQRLICADRAAEIERQAATIVACAIAPAHGFSHRVPSSTSVLRDE